MEVLKQMATEPVVDHVKHALTVEGINTFKNALASQICKEAEEKSSCDSAAMDLAIVLGVVILETKPKLNFRWLRFSRSC